MGTRRRASKLMLPQDTLSAEPVNAPFLGGRALPVKNLIDYETGGINIQDASQGLEYQVWKAEVINSKDIFLSAENGFKARIITGVNITEVSFTFDQNMRPVIAYVENGLAKLRWFDSAIAQFTTTPYPNIITPRLALDDKRNRQSLISDVIFAYLRDGKLFYRQQRDRYSIEHLEAVNVDSSGLIKIGMNRQYRMQFLLRFPE